MTDEENPPQTDPDLTLNKPNPPISRSGRQKTTIHKPNASKSQLRKPNKKGISSKFKSPKPQTILSEFMIKNDLASYE